MLACDRRRSLPGSGAKMSGSNRSLGPGFLAAGLALLLLLAALVVWLGWRARERAVVAERVARARLERVLETRGAWPPPVVPAAALGAETEWEEAREGDPNAHVIVRVGRAPLGDALSEAIVELTCRRSDGSEVVRSSTTDAIGVASFVCVAGEIVREAWVPARPGRAAGLRTLDHALAAGRLFGASVLVQPGCRVEGRVLAKGGRPAAGMPVLLSCRGLDDFVRGPRRPERETTCDADGRYAFDDVGPAYVVHAQGSSSISAGVFAGPIAGNALLVLPDLELVPARAVHGRVRDEAGAPFVGASVRATLEAEPREGVVPWPPQEKTTSADGLYALDPLPPGVLDLEVVGPGGARESVRVGLAWERADIVLRGDRQLAGTVLALGAPVAGARVELVGASRRSVTTDGEGRFHLAQLVAGGGALFADSGAKGSAWVAPLDANLAGALLLVHLDPCVKLDGTLADDEGRVVEGAVVRLTDGEALTTNDGTRYTRLELANLAPSTTDSAGRFAFERAWPGRFSIEVRHPDEPDLVLQAEGEAGGAPLALVWDRPFLRRVVIAGSVRDAQSGAALEAFDVSPLRRSETGEVAEGAIRSFRGAAGRFSIAGLAPGAYVLRVTAAGFLPFEREVGVLEEGEHAFECELQPLHQVELAFVDELGAPVPTGTVAVRREDGTAIPVDDASAARALEDGRVRLLVPAEQLELELALAGGRTLSYALDPRDGQGGEEIFVVDLDAHSTRDEARVLVLLLDAEEKRLEPGWFDEYSEEWAAILERDEGLFDEAWLAVIVRDRNGALVGRGTLARNLLGGWRSDFVLAHDPLAIVEQDLLPFLGLELPRRGFRLEVQAIGCERLSVAVDELRPNDLDSTRVLVLRRARR